MEKVRMVLEGGGFRGLFTAGVLDVLMDNNINVDEIIGVSAGALFGVNYFSNQRGRVIRYNKKFCGDKRYMSLKSWISTGNYINKEFAFYRVTKELDPFDNEAFKKCNKNYYAVVTNVESGKPEYIKITSPLDDLEVLRASSAVPMASRIIEIEGKKYLDGGIADSVPVECNRKNFDKSIVILTQPLDYKKPPLNSIKKFLVNIKYCKYPNLKKAMFNRHIEYNKRINEIIEMEKATEVFVIRPSEKINVKLSESNPERYQEIYDLGVRCAKDIMKDLKSYLKS